MEHIRVDIPGSEYDVDIARGLKHKLTKFLYSKTQDRKALIVTDDYFASNYARELEVLLLDSGFSVQKFVMSGGKVNKSFNEVLKIYGILESHDFARDSVLIAIGGGVIGDLAGFVASTWYRGMNLVNVPTTLMAMVDSSIGGKVAINYRDTVNAVGNYYHPIANYMDIELIDTLSERDYLSGLAEVIKVALIADAEFSKYLHDYRSQILDREEEHLVYCIKRAIEIKVDHVRHDVKEGGKRLLLNYGHTLGHAIEMATHTESGETFRHGEGVALGISAVLTIGESFLVVSPDVAVEARNLLVAYGLPVEFSAAEYGYERDELVKSCMRLMFKDKKRKDNQLRFVLVEQPGQAGVFTGIPEDQISTAFHKVIKE